MSYQVLFANNVGTTLAGTLASGATSATVASATGMPSPGANQAFALTLNDAATGLLYEVTYCTAVSGTTLTLVRGSNILSTLGITEVNNVTPLNWLVGDVVANLWTSGQAAAMRQSALLFPANILAVSGAFTTTTAYATGGIGLQASAPSSTTLPSGAGIGDTYEYEDLLGNFNTNNITVNAPGGHNIAGRSSIILNVNRQSAKFRYYGSSTWSVRTGT